MQVEKYMVVLLNGLPSADVPSCQYLVLQDMTNSKRSGESDDGDPVRLMDATKIGQFFLDGRNDTTAQDHHDQECGPFRGIFTEACNGQREDAGPHDGTT